MDKESAQVRAIVKAEFYLVTLALELAFLPVGLKPEQLVLTHEGVIDYIKARRVNKQVLKSLGNLFSLSPSPRAKAD
jgi:hypothetical protein